MNFKNFTRLYPLSKTIRFEARPIGNTIDNILKDGLIEKDEHRAESYQRVKRIIDEYHKAFIDEVMSGFAFDADILKQCKDSYLEKSSVEKGKTSFKDIQSKMRNSIAKALKENDCYERIFKKELIKEDLYSFIYNKWGDDKICGLTKEEANDIILEFKDFTTYFVGYNNNRENMYSSDDKSTAISHRLITENLPRFIDNIKVFETIFKIPEIQNDINELYANYEEYLNVFSIEDIFKIDYFNNVLTQQQIDLYNSIIGGKTENNEAKKVKGFNEYINLYNQQHKDVRLPKFKILYKQILSDRSAISWIPESFNSDQDVLNSINDCYNILQEEHILGECGLKVLLESINEYNLDKLYIRNDQLLNDISNKEFGSWNFIENAIKGDIKYYNPGKKKEQEEDYNKRIDNIYKKTGSFSIKYINDCIKKYYNEENKIIEGYFLRLGAVDNGQIQKINLFSSIANRYAEVRDLLTTEYPKNRNLMQDAKSVELIKSLLDSIKELQKFIKPLTGNGNESDKDERFYGEFSHFWDSLDAIRQLYDKVRNYLTRKPYKQEKIKLNFDNAQLLSGWDENKEPDYGCIILRKDGYYYVGIMNKKYRSSLSAKMPSDGECYEKMVYKLLPGANKMLPKVFFSNKNREIFNPSEELQNHYKEGTHKKGDKFNIDHCHQLIDFFKSSIEKHNDWSNFDFNFAETSKYHDISEFYQEVEQQGYKISFTNVSVKHIDQLVSDGKMYLFQLYNKDFSVHSKGTPNLHTIYWRSLFDEKNLKDVVVKLNGQAEMFFRKKSIILKNPTHPANLPIANKNKANPKAQSTFEYDLIKDRRYTVDKFMFHVPITLNFKSRGKDNIDPMVRKYLKETSEIQHVIGIDRGERHLLYVVVSDLNGNIKEQRSLNTIINDCNGISVKTDYHELLDTRESQRAMARQSWQSIDSIKDLKEGYLSHAVHIITQLMIQYRAIVVLEDLNTGFMRSRQKVEKQVYQKFEKMLIDKLNYLVDKKIASDEPGGVLRAYQLTSYFDSFQTIGKQSGFLFYVPAWNTSKIDPVTGFVNLFNCKYENIEKSKVFFSKFKSIRYNKDKNWFEFDFDYKDYHTRANGTQTRWVIITNEDRVEMFRNSEKNNKWDSRIVRLTDSFIKLFDEYNIDIFGNLKESIVNQSDKKFFEKLFHYLELTLQMRNSIPNTDIDYLISPVTDTSGEYYDSRKCDSSLPQNADANGAYNIARKGIMLINQIKSSEDKDLKNFKYDITNKSWLNFAQKDN